jgi:hypothetical protein
MTEYVLLFVTESCFDQWSNNGLVETAARSRQMPETQDCIPPDRGIRVPCQLDANLMSALRRNGPRVSQNYAPPVPAARNMFSVL